MKAQHWEETQKQNHFLFCYLSTVHVNLSVWKWSLSIIVLKGNASCWSDEVLVKTSLMKTFSRIVPLIVYFLWIFKSCTRSLTEVINLFNFCYYLYIWTHFIGIQKTGVFFLSWLRAIYNYLTVSKQQEVNGNELE